MTSFPVYLLKANLILALLYGFYYICLRRDTFYVGKRWYLPAVLVAAFVFPLIDFSFRANVPESPPVISQYVADAEEIYQLILGSLSSADYISAAPAASPGIAPDRILMWIFLSGMAYLLFRRLLQAAKIMYLISRSETRTFGNRKCTVTDRDIPPFSFFGHIVLNPSLYTDDELSEILTHEQVHCRGLHTVDILLAEAAVCLFWVNPVVWWLRNDLRQNLEYHADRCVLQAGFDKKHYQYNLLKVSGGAFQIVNHFHFNHLKKRIIMMNKKKSPRVWSLKYLMAIPVFAAAGLVSQVFGSQTEERLSLEKFSTIVDDKPDSLAVTLLLDPGSSVAFNKTSDGYEMTGTDSTRVQITINERGEQITAEASGAIFRGANTQEPDIRFRRHLGDALVILDGKEVFGSVFDTITPATIESISVLKDKTAVELYGERAANGAVIIRTKSGKEKHAVPEIQTIPDYRTRQGTTYAPEGNTTPTNLNSSGIRLDNFKVPYNLSDIESIKPGKNGISIITTRNKNHPLFGQYQFPASAGNPVLYVVDGVKVNTIEKIPPEKIESVTVLKNQQAVDLYGEEAKNGVIMVTTKK